MLEQTRRQASLFIYILFGILIVTFIYGLAPSTRQDGGSGCGTSSNTVVMVDGANTNQTSFLVAYSANGGSGRQKVYLALDQIIRRELLAQAAEERGLRVTGDLIDEEIKHGYFFLGGQRIDFKRQFFDQDGELFMIKQFKAWVGSLNVSTSSYREEQARGLQAAMMGDLLTGSVRTSRDEALADYLYRNNTVTYDVVAFEPGKYRQAMRLADADTKRFLDGHTAEVEARYKADERTYKGVKPQLALREIFIPKAYPEAPAPDKPADDKAAKPADDKAAKPADDKAAKPADDKAAKPADGTAAKPTDKKPDKAADKKPAAGAAPNPRGLLPDVAKAKLEAARAAIAAGKLTFSDAEKQLAADAGDDAPADNGDRGWRSVDSPGLEDKAVSDAVKTLKPGEMTPVIVTERGAYLVIATDKREGDLGFDQVKLEIAATLAKDVWSKEAAKRDALDTLAKAQAGTGKKLDQLFERELFQLPGGSIEELMNNPNLTEEQKQQLLQRYIQQQQQQKNGSLEVHEQDVPVAWYAEADGSANGTAATPASGSATGAAPAPAAGSSAAGTPPSSTAAAGAGGGSAAAPVPTPAAPAPTVIEASKDVLPQFAEIPKAKVKQLGPAPRQAKMPGVGGAKAAIEALFDELAPGDLAKHVYEGEAGSYVVLQLTSRATPKVEDFDKTADAELARMHDARAKAALRDWLKSRCETLTKAGKIRAAADRTREVDDKGNPAPTVYRPCMYFDYLDR